MKRTAGATDAEDLLRELYDQYWTRLVKLAGLLLGSSDRAEEVVQDALVAVYHRAERFGGPAQAYGYLRTSVVNACRSVHRHRNMASRKYLPPGAQPADPSDLVASRDSDQRMLAALQQLPNRQREVLIMRYYADASEAEIASTLGITRGAVKSHTHRGITALRDQLATQGASL